MPFPKEMVVGIVGAGAMGAGIAQVAACAGCRVRIYDTQADAASAAAHRIRQALATLVEKGKLERSKPDEIMGRISMIASLEDLSDARLVIEAIVEDLHLKRSIFRALSTKCSEDAVLATNTSSLSVTAVASAYRNPERVLGLHFFNPAPVMDLVEVIPALQTTGDLPGECVHLLRSWGKDPVVVKDVPGFLVNRIARPFYGEALRIVEDGLARPEEVDTAMRMAGGFRMGPFELMDLIGNDVNAAVTESMFEQTAFDRRYLPSSLQRRYVEAGYLGRKSGRGFYHYPPGSPGNVRLSDARAAELSRRILAMLMNEAAEALRVGLASKEDIERAMTKGTNYPKGLLHWVDEIGATEVVRILAELQEFYGDMRYRPSPLLKSMARDGARFYGAARLDEWA